MRTVAGIRKILLATVSFMVIAKWKSSVVISSANVSSKDGFAKEVDNRDERQGVAPVFVVTLDISRVSIVDD